MVILQCSCTLSINSATKKALSYKTEKVDEPTTETKPANAAVAEYTIIIKRPVSLAKTVPTQETYQLALASMPN